MSGVRRLVIDEATCCPVVIKSERPKNYNKRAGFGLRGTEAGPGFRGAVRKHICYFFPPLSLAPNN